MPYPDLATMYQNGMGPVASFMGGQMASQAQAQDAEKLKAMQLENAHSAMMNPLNAQFRQGEIARQGAELPGIAGNSQSLAAKGSEDTTLLPVKIASRISQMATQIGADGMQQMSQDAEKLSQAAQIMKQYPPAMQKQVLAKFFEQYGGNLNSPAVKGLMQASDDMIQPAAEALAKGIALAGSKYQQDATTHAATAASNEKIHAGNNAATIEAAKIAAASREAAAKTRASMMKYMNSDQALQALTAIPKDERTQAENERILEISQQRIAERTASASGVAPTVMGQDTPQQTGQKTAAAIHGTTTQQTAPANLPAGYKYAGTIKGVPTYENAEGKRIQWGK